MGLLIDGVWHDQGYDTEAHGGAFVRESPGFRNWIEADGAFAPEAGRYHLYVSLACPWAHRALILRRLKGLEAVIGLSIVDPYMGEKGWQFSTVRGAVPDALYGLSYLHELYQKAAPDYTGRVTTPTLWDSHHETIVSNESADILRMFNSAFDALAAHPDRDYYPAERRAEIDAVNEAIYEALNNGVYKAGFATSQAAYDNAYAAVFEALDWLDVRLAGQRYAAGDQITEADWRIFVTLVRFDAVYYSHFKCNRQRIADYAHLPGYLRELYQVPGVAETVDMDHIKQHYFRSHPDINPSGVVPLGPALDFTAPHGRDHLGAGFDSDLG